MWDKGKRTCGQATAMAPAGVQMRLKDLLAEWEERKVALEKITKELMPAFNEGFLKNGVRVLGK